MAAVDESKRSAAVSFGACEVPQVRRNGRMGSHELLGVAV